MFTSPKLSFFKHIPSPLTTAPPLVPGIMISSATLLMDIQSSPSSSSTPVIVASRRSSSFDSDAASQTSRTSWSSASTSTFSAAAAELLNIPNTIRRRFSSMSSKSTSSSSTDTSSTLGSLSVKSSSTSLRTTTTLAEELDLDFCCKGIEPAEYIKDCEPILIAPSVVAPTLVNVICPVRARGDLFARPDSIVVYHSQLVQNAQEKDVEQEQTASETKIVEPWQIAACYSTSSSSTVAAHPSPTTSPIYHITDSAPNAASSLVPFMACMVDGCDSEHCSHMDAAKLIDVRSTPYATLAPSTGSVMACLVGGCDTVHCSHMDASKLIDIRSSTGMSKKNMKNVSARVGRWVRTVAVFTART